jgi:hypothetical protein
VEILLTMVENDFLNSFTLNLPRAVICAASIGSVSFSDPSR